jgi:hypothetical protein
MQFLIVVSGKEGAGEADNAPAGGSQRVLTPVFFL